MIFKATPSLSFAKWLEDRKNVRNIFHRLESCGYSAVRNPANGHNRWRYRLSKLNGKETISQQFEVAIYALTEKLENERIAAARELLLAFQRDEKL